MMRTVRFNMLKLSLLAISLSALFVSCKDETEEDVESYNAKADKEAICFSTYTSGATRAEDVTSETLKKGFNVAALYQDGTLFFDEEAGYTEDINGKKVFDTTKDTYYWPTFSVGTQLHFYAFNNLDGVKWSENNLYKSIVFPIAENASEQKDLVVAHAVATNKPDGGIQPLNFTHALSKVNFSFAGADEGNKYTINRVEVIAGGYKELTGGGRANPTVTIASNKTTDTDGIDGSQPSQETQAGKVKWEDAINITSNNLIVPNKTNPSEGGKEITKAKIFTYYDGTDIVAGTESNPKEMNANFMLLPQTGKIAIRVYYKVEDGGGNLLGNCGYYETDGSGNHNVMLDADGKVVSTGGTNSYTSGGIKGCKTLIVDLGSAIAGGWQAGKSYRFVITLPTDNFLGDGANGNEPDGVADESDEGQTEDYDGDGDKDKSEFGMDEGYIEFSVSVKPWVDENYNANIVIK